VNPESLLDELSALAEAAGLRVDSMRPGAGVDGEPVATSGVCVLRGARWVLLSRQEPVEARIAVLVGALRDHCSKFLETRYLSPAVRERLEAPDPEAGRNVF